LLEPRQLLSSSNITSAMAFGSINHDQVTGIAIDPATNVACMVGTFSGVLTLNAGTTVTLNSKGGTDVFIAAYADGQILWAKSFGGAGDDFSGDVVIANTSLYVAGGFHGLIDADPDQGTSNLQSLGGADAFLLRFDLNGRLQKALSFGGQGDDEGDKITADAGGNLYLLGSFMGTADLDPGTGVSYRTAANPQGNVFVSKVTSAGNLVWADRYSCDDSLVPADLAVTPAGVPVLAGTFRGRVDFDGTEGGQFLLSSAHDLGFVTLLGSSGAFQWVKTFGDPYAGNQNPIRVNAFALDPQGSMLVSGAFSETIDIAPGAQVTLLSTSAEVHNQLGDNAYQGFVLKLDSAGEHLWSGALTGNASDALSILSDSAGNVYVGGDFQKVTDFDLTTSIQRVAAPDGATRSPYIAKYDPVGRWQWTATSSGGTGASHTRQLAVTPDNRTVAAGDFTYSVSFTTTATGDDPVQTVIRLDSRGDSDVFVLQLPANGLRAAVALDSSASEVLPAQGFTLTARVSGEGAPTGNVRFLEGSTLLGEFPLGADGKVAMPLSLSTPGEHVLTAKYLGDSNFAAATSSDVTVTVVIPQAPIGVIDNTTGGAISGWAVDYQALDTPLVVQILIDGMMRMALVADDDRPDLQPLLGTTRHGYTYPVPPLMAGSHLVQVIAFDPVTTVGAVIATGTVVSGDLYFDEAWYRRAYPDVAAAIASGALASGWQHFEAAGAHEGRSPSAFFDEMWYRGANPDVAAAIANGSISSGYAHFTRSGTREGRDPSIHFSEPWYCRAYGDVDGAVKTGAMTSGFTHYLLAGLLENRMPMAYYDPANYCACNADVSKAIAGGTLRSASDHFLASGIAEIRSPGTWYDEKAYVNRYPDLAAAINAHTIASGLAHFVTTGFAEGRTSATTFNDAAYLAAHPEASKAIADGLAQSPFQYYLLYGRLNGDAYPA
jgi:hypothetical protein